jgi:phosphotriesterase-related protein
MKRRAFLAGISATASMTALTACRATREPTRAREVMTVRGRMRAGEMGFTLTHEHLLANFQSYEESARSPLAYDRDSVARKMLPYLSRIASLGCRTFVDATAVGLGRDPLLLRQMSELSGLHILTATGNYAANQFRQLPPYVFEDSEAALAQRWIREWTDGIDGTGVRPGFIKLGFNGGPLSDVERKLIRAGARAHLATGLTIGAHTGPATAAFEELAELESLGVHPSAWIWIHAQNEKDLARHQEAARRGAWISLDGVQPDSVNEHAARILALRDSGHLRHVLVSQDAGWYWVGQPEGGNVRAYDTVFTALIPELLKRGLTQREIDTLFVENPANAFAIGVRTLT